MGNYVGNAVAVLIAELLQKKVLVRRGRYASLLWQLLRKLRARSHRGFWLGGMRKVRIITQNDR
jgi:hypothetical protein